MCSVPTRDNNLTMFKGQTKLSPFALPLNMVPTLYFSYFIVCQNTALLAMRCQLKNIAIKAKYCKHYSFRKCKKNPLCAYHAGFSFTINCFASNVCRSSYRKIYFILRSKQIFLDFMHIKYIVSWYFTS